MTDTKNHVDQAAVVLSPELLAAIFQVGTPGHSIDQQAAAIVGDVLVHFGAGYGAQRQSESGTAPVFGNIFTSPTDMRSFAVLLLESTVRNFSKLNWQTNAPLRDQVRRSAFKHGLQARQQVVADGTTTLGIAQILVTLASVKSADCPTTGAGGGPICDF